MTHPQVGVDIVAQDGTPTVFQQVGTRIQQWGAQSQTAADRFAGGFQKAASSITNLAGDALGANNKIANLVEGIGVMGIGGAWITGIAAGIAIVATGYSLITKEAREAREQTDRFIESQVRAADDASGKTLRDNLNGTIEKIKELKIAVAEGGQGGVGGWVRAFIGYVTSGQAGLVAAGIDNVARSTKALTDARTAADRGLDVLSERRKKVNETEARTSTAAAKEILRRQFEHYERTWGGDPRPELIGAAPPMQLRRTGFDQANEGALLGLVDNRIKPLSDEALRFDVAFQQAIAPLRDFNAEALTGSQILATLGGEVLGGVTHGFVGMFEAIGRGAGVFEGLKKAALKPVADKLRGYGQAAIAEGVIKLKEGIWPPNPLAIASGLGQIAGGGAAIATAARLGSGGGGGGSAVGGGAGSAGSFSQGQRDHAERDRGTLTVIWPDDAFADPGNPRFQEMMQRTLNQAMKRGVGRVEFIPRRG